MKLRNTEVTNIEEAFALLSEAEQAHCRRVAAYTQAAFKKAFAMDIYGAIPRVSRELQPENADAAYLGGLYHDIGKLLPDETEPTFDDYGNPLPLKDHTRHGEELIMALYPKINRIPAAHRHALIDSAAEHHERPDGKGTPNQKHTEELSCMGRIVAIANELDHRAMALAVEDPIGAALDQMKREAPSGAFDTELIRAFGAVRDKLRRAFDKDRADSAAVTAPDPWIRRRAGRPAQLFYRVVQSDDKTLLLCDMRFQMRERQFFTYAEAKHVLTKQKLDIPLGDYLLYELCDTLRRLTHWGGSVDEAVLLLPTGWYRQKNLADRVAAILSDEGTDAKMLHLLIPSEFAARPNKQLDDALPRLAALGLATESEGVFASGLPLQPPSDSASPDFLSEEDLILSIGKGASE